MTWLRLLLVVLLALPLAACEAIGDIFQAGMAVGVLMVVIVIEFLRTFMVYKRGQVPPSARVRIPELKR